jgi:hypothetical protein
VPRASQAARELRARASAGRRALRRTMMNCAEARRLIDANPDAPASGALEEHLRGLRGVPAAGSARCALWRVRFDARSTWICVTRRTRPSPRYRKRRRNRRAIVVVGCVPGRWRRDSSSRWQQVRFFGSRGQRLHSRRKSLHMQKANPRAGPASCPCRTRRSIRSCAHAGVTLDAEARDVVYAQSCGFRGHRDPASRRADSRMVRSPCSCSPASVCPSGITSAKRDSPECSCLRAREASQCWRRDQAGRRGSAGRYTRAALGVTGKLNVKRGDGTPWLSRGRCNYRQSIRRNSPTVRSP